MDMEYKPPPEPKKYVFGTLTERELILHIVLFPFMVIFGGYLLLFMMFGIFNWPLLPRP